MEGRWTIRRSSHQPMVGVTGPAPEHTRPIPVVPCDDAAMLRVRLAVQAELLTRTLTPAEIVDIAFRAAGETQ